MKIREYQYQETNISNCQERVIECESWTWYLNYLLCRSVRHNLPYPSIPRNSKIEEILYIDNTKIVCKYKHWKMSGWMIHVAEVL